MAQRSSMLIIACGALARELITLIRINGWEHVTVQCLPAEFHNRPEKIPAAVHKKIAAGRGQFERIFVAYGDCGTGGRLDTILAEEGVERIPGAHCYAFFAGARLFAELSEAEPGTFYLTDFLTRHFDRLVVRGLGLDRFPELTSVYFGHYRKLVYLAQVEEPALKRKAEQAAEMLGLDFCYRFTGYGVLDRTLSRIQPEEIPSWRS